MLLPWSILAPSRRTRDAESGSRSNPKKPKSRRPAARRLEVERLEDRLVPSVFHVDAAVTGPGSGAFNDPFRTIQDALIAATSNGVADQIIVYGNNTGNPQDVYVWTRDGDANFDLLPDRNMFVEAADSLILRSQTRTGELAPVVVKLQNNIIDIEGELRVEGATGFPVIITSLQDDAAVGDTNLDGSISGPNRLDWGGIRYRGGAVDMGPDASTGSFINYADIRYTGARLFDEVGGALADFGGVRMEFDGASAAQVRVHNTVFSHGGPAFDVDFRALGALATDANSVVTGPEIRNITFDDNSLNGLFVNIPFLPVIPNQDFNATWDDVGVPYVLSQRLTLETPLGNPLTTLTINAGMVIKSDFNAINAIAGQLFVDGTRDQQVIFTSLTNDVANPAYDNGAADTNNDLDGTVAAPGHWGGIIVSEGHVDHAVFSFGGGEVPINVGVFENQSPLRIITLDLRPLGPLQTFRVSNSEFLQTFTGTLPGGNIHVSPALDISGDGVISIIDNFVHDNQGLAIRTDSSVYHARPHELGGYGIHFARNVFEDNQINGVFTDTINNHGYLDDSDIVQTIGTGIFVQGTSQVFQIMSQRGAAPLHIDGAAAFLVRFDAARFGSNAAALNAFLSDPDIGLAAQQIVGIDEGPFPTNGDNGLFYYFIDFEDVEQEETGGLITLTGVGQGDPGNLRGEEWRDLGVDFVTSVGSDQMPLSVRANTEQDSFFSNTTPLAIADDFQAPTSSFINVSSSFTITDLNVHLDITHPRVSDLRIELIHIGSGTTVILTDQNGGTGQNFVSTGFDDEALTGVAAASAPFTGNFRPLQGLDVFDGLNSAGNWELRITDLATGQSGTLNSWALRIAGSGLADGDADPFVSVSGSNILTTADPSNGSFEIVFPNMASAIGFWIVDNEVTSPNERIEFIGDAGNVLESIALPTTSGGPVFVGRISAQPIRSVRVFEDADDSVGGVFTNSTLTPLVDGGTVTSTLSVASSFTISDLNVLVNISHPRPNDLQLVLIAPNGTTRISLANQVIDTGPNFTNTVFDDQGSVAVANASAPYTGSFSPDEPLAILNGTDANGTWTLEITDLVTGEIGTLNNWQLRFTSPTLATDHVGIDDLYFVEAPQSEVVKFQAGAGITAGGYDGKDVDALGNLVVGGTLRVLGQGAAPAVLTSEADDTAGAGVVQHVLWQTSGSRFDTNADGASTGTPGDWDRILINAGANSSTVENVVQQLNGTILRTSSDLNPYTIGDEVGVLTPQGLLSSDTDTLVVNPLGFPGVATEQNLQDGTLIEHADIRFSDIGIDYRGFPDDELSIEGNETEGNNDTATADPLQPLMFNGFLDIDFPASGQLVPDMVFTSYSGAARVGGSVVDADQDFYRLPDVLAGGRTQFVPTLGDVPYTELVVDVDHLGPLADPAFIFVFNASDQLIYASFDGFLGPIDMFDGDIPFLIPTSVPAFIRDSQYIVVSSAGRVPFVLVDPDGPFPIFTPLPGGGFEVLFQTSGTLTATPNDSSFVGGGGVTGGYELEVRRALPGGAPDREQDQIRTSEGEVIFRQNQIRGTVTAGVNLQTDMVTGAGGQLLSSQAARYFFPNGDPFANPDALLPGAQVYSNVVTGSLADGIRVIEDPLGLPGNTEVPSAHHLILNNTVHGNAGVGINVTTKGGGVVMNNVMTNNNVGLRVTDLVPNVVPPPITFGQVQVAFNLFFGNTTANFQGTFNGSNNKIGINPRYVDAANGDLRPFTGSPIIDAALSNLADRLITARVPGEPTRAPNDDLRDRARIDNGFSSNVGAGQFPFFDLGAFEANEPSLRVIGTSLFTGNQIIGGPIAGFTVDFFGRVDPATVNAGTVRLTVGGPTGPLVPIATITNTYDPRRNVHSFTFTLQTPIIAGTFSLLLDGVSPPRSGDPAIRDIAGQLLDGEFNNAFPSGNDVAGGSFLYTFVAQVGSIGNTVFEDVNGNGVQDSGEPGLPGVTVDLLGAGVDDQLGTADDIVFTPQITDSNGNYLFTPLTDGLYQVTVSAGVPAGFLLTTGNNPLLVSLDIGENFRDANFGFQNRSGSIGDLVWSDLDGDTIFDPGEIGIPGVDVSLVWAGGDNAFGTSDDESFGTQTTDAGGFYLFNNLPAGLHRVSVDDLTLPAGFVITTSFDPIDVTLANGQTFLGADFGYWEDFQNASIGNLVWNDINGNGIFDAGFGETGLQNVQVTLLGSGQDRIIGTADDVPFPSVLTNASGNYTFFNLPAWRYVVNVNLATVPIPPLFISTTNNLPLNLSLTPGQAVTTADFGFQETNATISGRVFNDLNGNGVQNGGEGGLNLVTVFVDRDNDGVLDPGERFDQTDALGDYTITQVGGGSNNVRVLQSSLPANFFNTTANPAIVILPNGSAGTSATGVNFGFELRDAFIGDLVFDDQNANGIFDPTEAGIPNVVVFADRDNNGVRGPFEPRGTTNANGIYSMQVPAGPNFIRVDTSTLPAGSFATTPAVLTRNVASGATDNTADFGFRLPSTFYFTLNAATTLISTDGTPSLAVTPRDIVKLTITGGTRRFEMYLQGVDIGLGPTTSENIDAFTFLPNGDILISTVGLVTLPTDVFTPGIGTGPTLTGNGEDVFRFTPTSVGSNVTGSWAMHLDGSDVGLSGAAENIDAISVLTDGRILFSTAGNVAVNGVSGFDTDLIAFTPISLGDVTAGTFSFFFDGSDVALTDNTVEDIDGLFVRETPGLPDLFFSARGAFTVAGVTGQDEDIFQFRPTSLGATTAGVYGPGLRLDGSLFGLTSINVLGFWIGTAPGAFPLTAAGFESPSESETPLPFRWAGAGTVSVLLADSLSSDQAARIRDAMAEINVHWQTTGTTFVEVGDPRLADIRVRLSSSTPAGGAAEGILGWSSFVIDTGIGGWLDDGTPFHQLMGHDLGIPAEVTLVTGWNWYIGADGTGIASDQYDFQSVVVHELGHMIGLDHSDDAGSIMSDTLATGVVRRQLSDSDRAAIDSLYAGAVLADLSGTGESATTNALDNPASVPALLNQAVPLSVLTPAGAAWVRPERALLDPLVSMLTPPATAGAVDHLFAQFAAQFAQAVEYPPRSLAHTLPIEDLLTLWTDPLEGGLI